jgi:alkanesulfonate monooxygenase SsuD/methylene tetrahydromethanopterin reductase-like flavin-dependent oxidoreductase (luciferase family)
VRIAQLEEAVQIIRALWTQSPANFEGKYYRIVNAECVPQPDPPIPIMIGGGGEKRMLRVVARHADWWNHNFCTPEEYAHKQRVLAGHCHEVGRDPHSIVYTYDTMLNITAHPADAGEPRDKGTYIISGTPDTVTRQLEAFVRLGVRHFQLRFLDFPSTRGLELFAEKVLPRLRAE